MFFFFKQKTAYEMLRSLVGSEMCIRDRHRHAVMVEALAEVHERLDRLVHDVVVELAARERTVAEAHGNALCLDPEQLVRPQLRDDHADRIRPRVDRSERRSAEWHPAAKLARSMPRRSLS